MKKIYLEGVKCPTKELLFKEMASLFNFPDYFGYNWDSFEEVITDLSWIDENEIELIISEYHLILSDESEDDIDIFFEILTNIDDTIEKSFSIEFEGDLRIPNFPTLFCLQFEHF